MNQRKHEPTRPPDYGDMKPRVIEFVCEMVLLDHKPDAPIRQFTQRGARCLSFRSQRCKRTFRTGEHGPIEMPVCAPWRPAKESDRVRPTPLFGDD